MNLSLSPIEAWQPLPSSEWTPDTARHLLHRACWTALPQQTQHALTNGMSTTLATLFPEKPRPFPVPALTKSYFEEIPELTRTQRKASSLEEKRNLQRHNRNLANDAYRDLCVKWLAWSSRPTLSAAEKWTLFLGDVYVVSEDKVRDPMALYYHQAIIRELGASTAPLLTKAISRSPAMLNYLDLQQSKDGAPNENFARELFELFTLGEGHYTENDIKEAARAFTGYRTDNKNRLAVQIIPKQHDSSSKKIFGKTGNFTGDDVIDLIYKQPAAAAFLPQEAIRFYITQEKLPPEYIAPLADWWRSTHYNLRALAIRIFSSRLFYDPQFRGNSIKSPIQFYLGSIQDLGLNPAPYPTQSLRALMTMGQMPYRPPNVRGWLGGRSWINSATLAARRQLIQQFFTPINDSQINANDLMLLNDARAESKGNITVNPSRLKPFENLPPDLLAQRLTRYFLATKPSDQFTAAFASWITSNISTEPPASPPAKTQKRPPATGTSTPELNAISNAIVTLLQTPEYQLC